MGIIPPCLHGSPMVSRWSRGGAGPVLGEYGYVWELGGQCQLLSLPVPGTAHLCAQPLSRELLRQIVSPPPGSALFFTVEALCLWGPDCVHSVSGQRALEWASRPWCWPDCVIWRMAQVTKLLLRTTSRLTLLWLAHERRF